MHTFKTDHYVVENHVPKCPQMVWFESINKSSNNSARCVPLCWQVFPQMVLKSLNNFPRHHHRPIFEAPHSSLILLMIAFELGFKAINHNSPYFPILIWQWMAPIKNSAKFSHTPWIISYCEIWVQFKRTW